MSRLGARQRRQGGCVARQLAVGLSHMQRQLACLRVCLGQGFASIQPCWGDLGRSKRADTCIRLAVAGRGKKRKPRQRLACTFREPMARLRTAFETCLCCRSGKLHVHGQLKRLGGHIAAATHLPPPLPPQAVDRSRCRCQHYRRHLGNLLQTCCVLARLILASCVPGRGAQLAAVLVWPGPDHVTCMRALRLTL